MTKNRKLYDTLGVQPDATHEQIRASYRARAKQVHPDNLDTGNETEFARLQIAHATLADADARSHYDATGQESGSAQGRNNTEAQALSLISTISQQIMDGGFGVDCDLARKIKDALSLSVAGQRTNRDVAQKTGDRLRRQVETIDRRWTGADMAKSVVIGGLQQRIDQTEAQLRGLDVTIKIWELAVSLMDGAIYEMPIVKPTEQQMQSVINGWKIVIG